ncbi:MAG TPA: THUMP domain-containing protein [Methanomassiliicoccaceae archaeon]|nr:THUMP domain-containing protein [Methanomassiliicoccaceae archaeon]HOL07143.1 THUMP domain-containing protein [Methanomassiliicoccaceae archaeon]HPP44740.1 THUMP domain-containing protein [Methanomassiliicoccaceae archaeon]
MKDYNVLVTYHPNEKAEAEKEVATVLRDAGIRLEDMMESIVPGLLHLRVEGDGQSQMRKLRDFALHFPDVFRHTHRWIPIEQWLRSTPDTMVTAARVFGERIGEDERWRVTLESRLYDGPSDRELVRMLADEIDAGPVDLENPQKMLIVEIIGEYAGFSLLSPEEYLDVNEARVERGLQKIF